MATHGDVSHNRRVWIVDEPYSKGVINRYASRFIPEDAAEELLNVDLEDQSRPKRRDGFREIRAQQTGFHSGILRIAGLGYYSTGPSSKLIVAAIPGSEAGGVFYVSNPDSSSGWGEATVSGKSFNVDTDDCKMFQSNDLLWIIPGTSRNVHVLQSSGSLIDAGNLPSSPPKGAADGTSFLRRAWFLAGQALHWSKVLPTASDLSPETGAFNRDNSLSTGGGSLTLSPPFGVVPVALSPWNPRYLVAFYDRAIQAVSVDNADPSDSTVELVERNIGCASRRSVLAIGQSHYFVDQYGQFRELSQTISATQSGVVAEPLSESIAQEIPGKVTNKDFSKIFCELLDDRIYVFYPREPSTESNACMVWDTSRQMWYGPWVFDRPFSSVIPSDIRGEGFELFASDGSTSDPTSAVYRLFDGGYSDNGVAISYRETARCWDLGHPELDKLPKHLEIEAKGGISGDFRGYLRTDENNEFTQVSRKSLENNSDSSFPLTEDDFPLTSADFPLKEVTPQITRSKVNLDPPLDGDFPVYNKDTPIDDADFPVLGAGGGVNRGRFVQVRITESTNGQPFERVGFRIAVHPEPADMSDE